MILIVLPDYAVEDQLLARARRGDTQALRQIYELYFPPIYGYLRLRMGDMQQAEDLAGDVFVRLVEAVKGRKAPRDSLRGWLFQVARHLLADHHRRGARFTMEALEEWLPAAEDGPEATIIHLFDLERLRSALDRLTPDQQEVLVLRFGQRLSLEDTAAIMGRNANAIKALQFRATQTLRHLLSDSPSQRDAR